MTRIVSSKPSHFHRCKAIMGTATAGPKYCGRIAFHRDPNGRPVCRNHKFGHSDIDWFGDRAEYPNGTRGNWRYVYGVPT